MYSFCMLKRTMKRLVQLRIHLDARFKAQKYSVGNKKEKILLNV